MLPIERQKSLDYYFTPEAPGETYRTIPFLRPLIDAVKPDHITPRDFQHMVDISRIPDPTSPDENPEKTAVLFQNTRLRIGDGTGQIPNFYGLFTEPDKVTQVLRERAKYQQEQIGSSQWPKVTKQKVGLTLTEKGFDIDALLFLDWCQGDASRYFDNKYRKYSSRAVEFRSQNSNQLKPYTDGNYIKYSTNFMKGALNYAEENFMLINHKDQSAIRAIQAIIPSHCWTNKIEIPDPENPNHWFLLLGKTTRPLIRGGIKLYREFQKHQEIREAEEQAQQAFFEWMRSRP